MVAVGQGGERSDLPLILEAEEQLASSLWWRQWALHGVVMISWGLPRYEPIVRAIKDAGVRIVLKLDTDGVFTPRVWLRRYIWMRWASLRDEGRKLPMLQAILRTFYNVLFSKRQYGSLIRHLQLADAITVESPLAYERYRRGLDAVGGRDVIPKLRVLPHPVADIFKWENRPKESLIVAVGRWDAFIKGAPLLIEVLSNVLRINNRWRAAVIGPGTDHLRELLSAQPTSVRERVAVKGELASECIVEDLQRASVSINTSHSESFGIAMAEALACGASIVGCAEFAAMNWFASAQSGTLAATRHSGLLGDALGAEIRAWEQGLRDPSAIASFWGPRVRVSNVARTLIELPDIPARE